MIMSDGHGYIDHGQHCKHERLHHTDEDSHPVKQCGYGDEPRAFENIDEHSHDGVIRKNVSVKTKSQSEWSNNVTDDFDSNHQRRQPKHWTQKMFQIGDAVFFDAVKIVNDE